MVEEFPKVNELSQAQEVIEESIVLHVEKDASKEEHCDLMRYKNIEKENIEIKEKERVEYKERSCISDSISIFSKESEHLECSKEKERELEKSERVKENECFIEKQENEKEEQREKEIVILDKCGIHEYYDNVAHYASCVLGIEDKGKNMEQELGATLKDLPIILSLNPSLMCSKVSLVELELFLESYLSHVSIYGDLYVICFGGGLFLVVPSTYKCLSSHTFLEDSLLFSGSMFDPSCHDFGVMYNASIEYIVVGFGLDGALFDILHDKCLGKFVEIVAMFPLSLILLRRIIMSLFS
ncbi:hypothetical protein M9H77_23727 [Catharanthus roseus]|uniref:Uncharacterized protein n=1 Tax=Catharanthus roseus TaxID=4058 RepID=A0ACC0AU31_CATRO|nr:hypothetical protein M9H77_23727 [Catharanthus roseus]